MFKYLSEMSGGEGNSHACRQRSTLTMPSGASACAGVVLYLSTRPHCLEEAHAEPVAGMEAQGHEPSSRDAHNHVRFAIRRRSRLVLMN
jgi:hypothetical protein